MSIVTYSPTTKSGVRVYLDGKFVGEIKQVGGGWAYFPTGHMLGDVFTSISAVKKSIEAE